MKNSMVLLELLVSLILFSFLAISSSKMLLTLIDKNNQESNILESNLILETTRLFIQKHNDFSLYSKIDDSLYFQGDLLLKNISSYGESISNNVQTINICINNDKVCQIWKIKI